MILVLGAALPLLCLGENEVQIPGESTQAIEELRRLVFVERKNPPKKTVPAVSHIPGNLFAQPNVPRTFPVPQAVPAPQVVPRAPRPPRAPMVQRQAPWPAPRVFQGLNPETIARLQPHVMDRLRKGQPPLPIPLTPASIETLTEEGVEIPDYLRP